MVLNAVLIKPVSGLCDMNCDYCFYRDEAEKRKQASYGFMSEETLKRLIKKALLQAQDSVCFAFQGGEPTLRGLPFFEKVVEFEKLFNKRNIKISNSIQTNGYGLDDAWCAFFREHQFLVGVSLDGNSFCHDAYRHGSSGEQTYERVRVSIELLKKHGVDYNILTVVNQKTAADIRNIYQLYKQEGWQYQQYIACLDPLEQPRGQKEYSLTPETYGKFLIELFELWYKDWKKGKQPSIRMFENYVMILMGHVPESCEQRGSCSIQGVIEADGSVFPCDFYALDEYCLGNINDCRLSDILDSDAGKRFVTESRIISEKCRKCEYYGLCRDGCRRNRMPDGEGGMINYFCESYRMFFEKAYPRLKEMAEFYRLVNDRNV